MTPISRFKLKYWLDPSFAEEVIRATGAPPYWASPGAAVVGFTEAVDPEALARFVKEGLTPSGHQRRMLAKPHPGLEVVLSHHKSLTLARINAGEDEARQVRRLLDRVVAEEFGRMKVWARTGAGGLGLVEALPIVAVAPQGRTKAWEALDHWHVYVAPVAYVPALGKLLAIDQRRFHADVHRTGARIDSRFAEVYRDALGSRMEIRGTTLVCADVPEPCVDATSTRKQQVHEYRNTHGVAPTPLARKIAAYATRAQNGSVGPSEGVEEATRRVCRENGFDGSKVYGRKRPLPEDVFRTCRLILDAARDLAKERGRFTRLEHEALAQRRAVTANVRASEVDRVVERVYANPLVFGIHRLDQEFYTNDFARFAWEKLREASAAFARSARAGATRGAAKAAEAAAGVAEAAEKLGDRALEEVLGAAREGAALVWAFGRAGMAAVRRALAKHNPFVHREVLVRDVGEYLKRLKPLPRGQAHRAAARAACSPSASSSARPRGPGSVRRCSPTISVEEETDDGDCTRTGGGGPRRVRALAGQAQVGADPGEERPGQTPCPQRPELPRPGRPPCSPFHPGPGGAVPGAARHRQDGGHEPPQEAILPPARPRGNARLQERGLPAGGRLPAQGPARLADERLRGPPGLRQPRPGRDVPRLRPGSATRPRPGGEREGQPAAVLQRRGEDRARRAAGRLPALPAAGAAGLAPPRRVRRQRRRRTVRGGPRHASFLGREVPPGAEPGGTAPATSSPRCTRA